LANVLKEFENIREGNLEEWLQSDMCEPAFHYMTDAGVISAAAE
jgi:hypothetical protein